jgi:hypothetical protein
MLPTDDGLVTVKSRRAAASEHTAPTTFAMMTVGIMGSARVFRNVAQPEL